MPGRYCARATAREMHSKPAISPTFGRWCRAIMLTTSLIAGIKQANSENISGPRRRSATCSKGKGSAVDSTPTAIQQSKTQVLCQPAAIANGPTKGTVKIAATNRPIAKESWPWPARLVFVPPQCSLPSKCPRLLKKPNQSVPEG